MSGDDVGRYVAKFCLFACLVVPGLRAQTKAAAAKQGKDQLRMVVILSRHGVRSPTWAQTRLDSYSSLPWPKWGVAPGELTTRGFDLVKTFAGYDRAWLAEQGLVAPRGCADASRTYIWADTDQRTMESGRALAEGLFPGCAPKVHSLAEGENDPLFHPTAHGVTAAKADAAYAEFAVRAKEQSDAEQPELIDAMQRVLMGCGMDQACSPARPPAVLLSGGPVGPVRGKGDHIVDLQGPLAPASTLAEDLLLEYGDGMPMSQVGWGKVEEAGLRRLLKLHSDYFELMHRTPAMARLESSNMLAHIVRTLQQGVERKSVAGALGSSEDTVVMLAGHDTNLAGVASLLGVHWNLDGRQDDTPPGTELAFELWQDGGGRYSVRVTVSMQSLRQMREATVLTLPAPPVHQELTLPGCGAASCGWKSFQGAVDGAIDLTSVY